MKAPRPTSLLVVGFTLHVVRRSGLFVGGIAAGFWTLVTRSASTANSGYNPRGRYAPSEQRGKDIEEH